MIKKKSCVFLLLAILLLVLFVGVLFMKIMQSFSPKIQVFDVNQYQDCIEEFPSGETLGPISNVKDLLKKVEAIWIREYGLRIKKEKPYHVFYDETNDIWLVHGTLPFYYTSGGTAYILVENDTGKVLAVWHEK